MNRDKVIGMFLGVAIGDALGTPVEYKTAADIAATVGRLIDYIDPSKHRWHGKLVTGDYTDDSVLSFAIAESLIKMSGVDLDSLAQFQAAAMQSSPSGFGKSTKDALNRIISGISWRESGTLGTNGNGIAMKIAPLAAYYWQKNRSADLTEADNIQIAQQAAMTHRSDVAVMSGFVQIKSLIYCLEQNPESFSEADFQINILNAMKLITELSNWAGELSTPDDSLYYYRLSMIGTDWLKEMKITSSAELAEKFGGAKGNVVDSQPFSLLMFLRHPKSIETLYDTVNAGGDTDTNASMVGALLGALNGTQIFPSHLINGLRQKDYVLDLANRFCDRFGIKE